MARLRIYGSLVGAALAASAACTSLSGLAEGDADDPPRDQAEDAALGDASGADSASPDSSGLEEGSTCAADVKNDPKNCGRCGRDCLGGTCADGGCGPVAILSLPGEQRPVDVVLRGNDLLWTGYPSPGLFRCDLSSCDGGTNAPFLTDVDSPSKLAADPSYVFFTDARDISDAGLYRCPASGCTAATPIALHRFFQSRLHTAGGAVYFGTDVVDGGALASSLDRCVGTTCASLASPSGPVIAVAVDATHAYWLQQDGLFRCLLSDCATTVFSVTAAPVTFPTALALSSTHVYWVETQNVVGSGRARRCPLNGCTTPETVAANLRFPVDLVIDSQHVYVLDTNFGGPPDTSRLVFCPLAGCPADATVLVAGLPTPVRLTSNADALYWADFGGIYRIRKPD